MKLFCFIQLANLEYRLTLFCSSSKCWVLIEWYVADNTESPGVGGTARASAGQNQTQSPELENSVPGAQVQVGGSESLCLSVCLSILSICLFCLSLYAMPKWHVDVFNLWHKQTLFLFLGASIVCVNNLKRTADLVLWFPDRTSVCTHPWLLYNLIVLKASLNPTKLN